MVYEVLLTIPCLCITWRCLLCWVMNKGGSTRISCEFFWGFILVISFWVTSHISLVLKCKVLETWLVSIIRKWHSYYRLHNFLIMFTELSSGYFWWNGQVSQDSVVSVGTCYGLDCLEFEPLLGCDFSKLSTLALSTAIPLPPLSASLACYDITCVFSHRGQYLWDNIIYLGCYYKKKNIFKDSSTSISGKSGGHLLGLLQEVNLIYWQCLCHWMKYLILTNSERPTDWFLTFWVKTKVALLNWISLSIGQ